MTKTQFLPIFLGRRYARSQYFCVQNFQGIHVFGFEFYPPYTDPRVQIYEVPPWDMYLPLDLTIGNLRPFSTRQNFPRGETFSFV